MKHIMFPFVMYVFVFGLWNARLYSDAESSYFNLFSNLPAGPYKVIVKKVEYCDNKPIQIMMNLCENSFTRFKGNISTSINLDDTIFFEFTLAYKGPNSKEWKENVMNHKAPKMCSTFKALAGEAFHMIVNGLGINYTECPLRKGYYVGSEIDLKAIVRKMNIPQTFIYGRFKVDFSFTRANEKLGCNMVIYELVKV